MITFMRYSLRNKEKIIEAIGQEKFNLLIKELNEKFQIYEKNFDMIKSDYEDKGYKVIKLKSFEVYHLTTTYFVYNLAFKGEI